MGVFDGVHRAHQVLLGRAVGESHATGGIAVALTFRNHPRSVLSPAAAPKLLTPWPAKRRLLERLRLDAVVALEFDAALSRMEAADFVREVLVGRCGAATVHSGWNFRFGRGGAGGPDLLAALAPELGYRYERLEPITAAGARISSTRIRDALLAGDPAAAADLLGRPHQIEGPVVSGDRLGRTIGFPTANIVPREDALLPADGVYAVHAQVDSESESRPGMMNIGFRPTVDGKEHRCEVHLLDFDGDLEGKALAVQFAARLRGEVKFDGLASLQEQLGRDREAALAALAGAKAAPFA